MWVGYSAIFYFLPFVWSAWPVFLLTVPLSFMSDYVKTGRDSWWHPADRTLASFNSIHAITLTFTVLPRWLAALFIFAVYPCCYGLSVSSIRRRHFYGYVVGHTLWHVVGGLCGAYVTYTACGPVSSFSDGCVEKYVTSTLLGGRPIFYCGCVAPLW